MASRTRGFVSRRSASPSAATLSGHVGGRTRRRPALVVVAAASKRSTAARSGPGAGAGGGPGGLRTSGMASERSAANDRRSWAAERPSRRRPPGPVRRACPRRRRSPRLPRWSCRLAREELVIASAPSLPMPVISTPMSWLGGQVLHRGAHESIGARMPRIVAFGGRGHGDQARGSSGHDQDRRRRGRYRRSRLAATVGRSTSTT